MIVSASYRTDIPAFYGAWFMNRLDAGFCRVANPYGGPPYRVELDPTNVDGFVFWTRNIGPFIENLADIRARVAPFVVHHTITGYPRVLEPAVVRADTAIRHMHRLARDFGPRAQVWRYDPVIETSLTTADWHAENFARLAERLAGATDEVVISFAHIYRKTERNLGMAAKAHGFDWRDPDAGEKHALARRLAKIAEPHGMRLTLCSQPDFESEDVPPTACIDAVRLSEVAGRDIEAPRNPHRPGCGCWQSRDIGAYDSCPQGCVYCYAVATPAKAREMVQKHRPEGEYLCGER